MELLETWLILEYCDCGSLEDAAMEGKYRDDLVGRLPMPFFATPAGTGHGTCTHCKGAGRMYSEYPGAETSSRFQASNVCLLCSWLVHTYDISLCHTPITGGYWHRTVYGVAVVLREQVPCSSGGMSRHGTGS